MDNRSIAPSSHSPYQGWTLMVFSSYLPSAYFVGELDGVAEIKSGYTTEVQRFVVAPMGRWMLPFNDFVKKSQWVSTLLKAIICFYGYPSTYSASEELGRKGWFKHLGSWALFRSKFHFECPAGSLVVAFALRRIFHRLCGLSVCIPGS